MGGESISSLFLTSLEAISTLLVQYLIGALIAWKGLVTPTDIKGLNSVLHLILIPSLSIASLGEGLSVELLGSEGWILAVIGFLAMVEFALFGLALRTIAKPSAAFHRLFVICCALPNVVAVPLSITQNLCELGAFDDEFASAPACAKRARTYTFMYILFNSPMIWVFAYSYLTMNTTTAPIQSKTLEPAVTTATADPAGPLPSGLVASEVKLVVSEVKPSVVVVNRVYEERSVYPSSETKRQRWDRQRVAACKEAKFQAGFLLRRPPIIGMLIGLFIGLVAPVQEVLFDEDAPLHWIGLAVKGLGTSVVPCINLMMAFSLGHKLRSLGSWRELLGSTNSGISQRTLFVLTCGRLIILPAIHGAILYALLDSLPSSRLFRTLLFVEMAPPTASIVVVLAQVGRKPELAQLCAFALVPQYLVAVFTLTFAVAFALKIA